MLERSSANLPSAALRPSPLQRLRRHGAEGSSPAVANPHCARPAHLHTHRKRTKIEVDKNEPFAAEKMQNKLRMINQSMKQFEKRRDDHSVVKAGSSSIAVDDLMNMLRSCGGATDIGSDSSTAGLAAKVASGPDPDSDSDSDEQEASSGALRNLFPSPTSTAKKAVKAISPAKDKPDSDNASQSNGSPGKASASPGKAFTISTPTPASKPRAPTTAQPPMIPSDDAVGQDEQAEVLTMDGRSRRIVETTLSSIRKPSGQDGKRQA